MIPEKRRGFTYLIIFADIPENGRLMHIQKVAEIPKAQNILIIIML